MEPSPDDGLVFPNEPGFTGFPSILPADTVTYEIRLLNNVSETELRDELRKIQNAATQLTRKLLKSYIWQRESFRLDLVKEHGRSLLRGRTDFGDAIEDEWLMVYLLRELSRQFHSAWIRVTDVDGEFLLVEAANVLPKWLNPDVAEHRVWINRGELWIVPQSKKEDAKFLSMPQALDTIQGPREALLHSTLIEEEAFFRLRNYPAQIQQNMHHALLTIPRRLAFILHHLPASISPAIEAFYLRDPIALRPLSEDSVKALTFPPQDFVTARIKFPRVGYAQVRSQRFTPAGAWAVVVAEHADKLSAKQKEHAEIGMKVASGFEMLMSDPQNQDKSTVREIKILFEDLEKGDEALPTDAEIQSWGTTEDDDAWMDIDFEDFERELGGSKEQRGSGQARRGQGFGDKAAQENLQKLVSRFEEFLNADGLADESDDDEEHDDEEISDDELLEGEDKDASFTEDEFTALMREMMGMPEETMREMMGPDAAKAKGLGARDHPDFTEETHAQGLEERMAKLFQELDSAAATAAAAGPTAEKKKKQQSKSNGKQRLADNDDDDDDDDEAEIKHLSALMEAELRKSGALDLSDKDKGKGKQKTLSRVKEQDEHDDGEDEEDSDEEVQLDDNFNLVANMLRSYKGQAGAAGPAGNLMGMMGVAMPRDEGEEDDQGEGDGSKRESGEMK